MKEASSAQLEGFFLLDLSSDGLPEGERHLLCIFKGSRLCVPHPVFPSLNEDSDEPGVSISLSAEQVHTSLKTFDLLSDGAVSQLALRWHPRHKRRPTLVPPLFPNSDKGFLILPPNPVTDGWRIAKLFPRQTKPELL